MKRRCDKPDGHEEKLFDRVFQLEAEVERLRAALEEVVKMFDLLADPFEKTAKGNSSFIGERLDHAEHVARAALAKEEA